MSNTQNVILKIISLGFFLHFIQWFFIETPGASQFSPLFWTYAGGSLIASILLLVTPKIGINFALFRSLIGIFWAIVFGQFLNLNLLITSNRLKVWPSAFFLVTILLLLYIKRSGTIFQEGMVNIINESSFFIRWIKYILIFLALLIVIGMLISTIAELFVIFSSLPKIFNFH